MTTLHDEQGRRYEVVEPDCITVVPVGCLIVRRALEPQPDEAERIVHALVSLINDPDRPSGIVDELTRLIDERIRAALAPEADVSADLDAPLPSIAALRARCREAVCGEGQWSMHSRVCQCRDCDTIRALDAVTYRLRDLKSIVSDPEWNYGYLRDGEKMATLDALLAPDTSGCSGNPVTEGD